CVALLAMVVLSLATPSMSRAQATAILTSNFATLPGQPQSPGSIRVLTNKDRGVWLSTGANWYSAGGNFCNVKAFDALGDGLTDDTASIQRALDGTQCGVVLLPAGAYKVSGPLALARDTVITGVGKQRTIIISNSTTADVFRMT